MKGISRKTFFSSRYNIVTIMVSIIIAVLLHFMEILSLFDVFESEQLFDGITPIAVFNEVIFTILSLYILFQINTIIFKFNQPLAKITWKKVAFSFLLMMAASSTFAHIFILIHNHLPIKGIVSTLHHYLHPIRDLTIASLVTGTCYLMNLLLHKQFIVIENQELKTQNIINQYEALKSQLNPHMLFNSLNTLLVLIREDQPKAHNYTSELSKVLRYTLQNDDASVTLFDELEFTKAYIYLMKMRYEENLKFDIDIDDRYMHYRVPHISLQLLVENAIKHNEISARNNLNVTIKTNNDNCLCVENIIKPKRNISRGNGIGLENLNKRYNLLYHREITISHTNNTFKVNIPLIATIN